MKRLIKYTSPYEEINFSDCSTKYEVLPYVVDDSAGTKELRELAELLEFNAIGNAKHLTNSHNDYGTLKTQTITDSLVVEKTNRLDYWGKKDTRRPVESTRLGFITILDDKHLDVKLDVGCDGVLDSDKIYSLLDSCNFDIRDIITIDGETMLLVESWDAFHHMEFLGYSFKQLLEVSGCTDTIFEDSVFSCSECGEWDYNDSGCTYNYTIIECEQLGHNCGCYKNFCESDDALDHYKNNADSAMMGDAAETHIDNGNLEFLERFVGGITDPGRSHSYGGDSVGVSSPQDALKKYQLDSPDSDFIFVHDESGQFQTYYSIYKVKGGEK